MNVRFIFFKAFALCAILVLSSCQSKEEKLISKINDLAEQIEKNGEDWDAQDWMEVSNEYAQICMVASKCEFSEEQQEEFIKAGVNLTAAFTANAPNAYSNVLAEGVEAYSKELAKGMEALSDELVDDEEDLDDEEDMDEEDMDEEDMDDEDSDDEDSDDEIEDNGQLKVYSNCYDGYLNIRAEPTSKSKILGTLPNGPEGAELLGVEGKWSKVRVNGVVGYIWSADVQSTPTEPVFISASDVVGEWAFHNEYSGDAFYRVKSNGKFEFYDAEIDETRQGTWYLSRNSIVFKFVDGDGLPTATVSGREMNFGHGAIYRKK